MSPPRATPAALRAVQQYRRRDVVPYLALRYYLANSAARRSRWAEEIAVDLVLERKAHPYFVVKHFKGYEGDTIRHREMCLPGANEALAEAFLLGECARHVAFKNPDAVFSYHLAGPDEVEGVFRHYFNGLRRRQQWLAQACRSKGGAVVRYADVRTFYPSIRPDSARNAWASVCNQANLPERLVRVGHSLLDAHLSFGSNKLLTGPMFSHVLGNLVLRPLDEAMMRVKGVAYCRYVDDIVLVGAKASVDAAYTQLEERLGDLGLALHPTGSEKHIEVDARAWLLGEMDFDDSNESISWKHFVGGLKWLLTSAPERRSEIQKAARREGFRIPIPDYSGATREASYVQRLKAIVRLKWFKERRRGLEVVIAEGRLLRDRYLAEIGQMLGTLHELRGYERKRIIPKIRYRAGRLAYLASRDQLASLGEDLRMVDELRFHAATLLAIATGDVTDVIRLGANVAQAVAQPLHAEDRAATVQGPIKGDVELHGLAVLALNGVEVSGGRASEYTDDEFLRFAHSGADREHLRSKDAFIREFAALHGVDAGQRHALTLDSAFDAAEDSVFDALGQAIYLPSEW